MRSTSSGRRLLAALVSLSLFLEGAGGGAVAAFAGAAPEPCLLLKYSAPSVPEETARRILEPMPELLLRTLDVRWVPAGPARTPAPAESDPFAEADDAVLDRIGGKIAEAMRRMDRMDTKEAKSLLSDAEASARKFRLSAATRQFLAEIFLRKGVLFLWEENRAGAEEMFARSRALRPDFSPDPGLFSPAFRESWDRAAGRDAPEGEILVQTVPPGATVRMDGIPSGNTPGRFKVRTNRPVRVRVSFPGFQDMEWTGQWLPGDSEAIDGVLARDRIASLGETLAISPEGKGTAGLLDEIAESAGVSRVALLVLGEKDGKYGLKVLSAAKGRKDPALLGEFDFEPGEAASPESAGKAARILCESGWPAAKLAAQEAETPWYHKTWFWILMGAIAVGAVAGGGGGGGGGSSGSSSGAIGVTF